MADYQGAGRTAFTWGSVGLTDIEGEVKLTLSDPSLIPVNDFVEYRYIAAVEGGNATLGDSTGECVFIEDRGDTLVSTQGLITKMEPALI